MYRKLPTSYYLINTYDCTNIFGCVTVIMYFMYFIVCLCISNIVLSSFTTAKSQ